jgi:non-ribosomal peptide synthetase-like protein
VPGGRIEECAGPIHGTEGALVELLAELLGVPSVPMDSHFFTDLGADSLVMAHFCARVRKRPDLPRVSIKDIYRHPTIRSLAAALAEDGPAPASASAELPASVEPLPVTTEASQASPTSQVTEASGATETSSARYALEPTDPSEAAGSEEPTGAAARCGAARYALCGALQLLLFVGYSYLVALMVTPSYEWISTGTGPIGDAARSLLPAGAVRDYRWILTDGGLGAVYLRSLLFGAGSFAALCLLPIVAKWTLIGRWKPGQIPLWGLGYLRFWLVKTLVRTNPLVLFVGSPLYVLYLRALGAKIGRGVAIFSRGVPVCTDLLTIGAGSVVRKESLFAGYRAWRGVIQTGRVTLGKGALVAERTVLDINTSLGDGAQLGHASALQAGQRVPDGEHWHGCPGRPTTADFQAVEARHLSAARRLVYPVLQLVAVLAGYLPLLFGGTVMLLVKVPRLATLVGAGPLSFTEWAFYRDALVVSAVVFLGVTVLGLLVMLTVPRLVNLALTPGKAYRLYGIHYSAQRLVAVLTNSRFFTRVFGDSSAIVHYLRGVGYDLSPVEQTGSNFGTIVTHDNPYLCKVGTGTMVADGLAIINAEFSATSFQVCQASIGARNFVGNRIVYPARGRTGENCLLATKVMVPVDGPVRRDVGLLGSPCFEIPRSVERDGRFDELKRPGELRRRLRAKNRHNAATAVIFLFSRWLYLFGVTLLAGTAMDLYDTWGVSAFALWNVAQVFIMVAYFVAVDRVVLTVHPVRPTYCSIYERSFWRHERYWKVPAETYLRLFDGTPLKPVVWRLLGARVGKRLFDDGCYLPERPLVSIGDHCTLNVASIVQGHSQEDGAFKSDRISIGSGCTLGVGALVHYGVVMDDDAVLDADAFLMKGEQVPRASRWSGNPAVEARPCGARTG